MKTSNNLNSKLNRITLGHNSHLLFDLTQYKTGNEVFTEGECLIEGSILIHSRSCACFCTRQFSRIEVMSIVISSSDVCLVFFDSLIKLVSMIIGFGSFPLWMIDINSFFVRFRGMACTSDVLKFNSFTMRNCFRIFYIDYQRLFQNWSIVRKTLQKVHCTCFIIEMNVSRMFSKHVDRGCLFPTWQYLFASCFEKFKGAQLHWKYTQLRL